MPKSSITMGVGTIMEARHIILMASGSKKADTIKTAIEGEVNSECTASVLQNHSHITYILDKEAAAKLSADTLNPEE